MWKVWFSEPRFALKFSAGSSAIIHANQILQRLCQSSRFISDLIATRVELFMRWDNKIIIIFWLHILFKFCLQISKYSRGDSEFMCDIFQTLFTKKLSNMQVLFFLPISSNISSIKKSFKKLPSKRAQPWDAGCQITQLTPTGAWLQRPELESS